MAEQNTDTETLDFNAAESYFLIVCIDEQVSTFRKGEKNPRILVGGKKVESAILDTHLASANNCRLLSATSNKERCSFVGLKNAFIEAAKRVGENGIFFFYFSGHGVTKLGFGIASMDYDNTHNKCITATTLREWLNEACFKAKYAVLTLDSCNSGGIAEAFTRGSNEASPLHKFQILTSCKAREASFTIESLGCSIFSYFLSHVIKATCRCGHYPIRAIYERCYKLCKALSSLFIEYSDIGPYERTTNIEWKSTPLSELMNNLDDEKEQGANMKTEVGIPFSYPIMSHYTWGNKHLHIVSYNWLLSSCYKEQLPILAEDGPETWDESLVEAVFHGMMRSTAILQQHYAPDTVATTNIYVTAFMYVATTILAYQQIEFDKYYCRKGLKYYNHGLYNISEEEMEPLKQLELKLQE